MKGILAIVSNNVYSVYAVLLLLVVALLNVKAHHLRVVKSQRKLQLPALLYAEYLPKQNNAYDISQQGAIPQSTRWSLE